LLGLSAGEVNLSLLVDPSGALAKEAFENTLKDASKYDALEGKAILSAQAGDYRKAKKRFERCIELDPRNPKAYYNFANMLNFSGSGPMQAASLYLKCVELAQPSGTMWTNAACGAYHHLSRPECADALKPAWLTDPKELSRRADAFVELIPNDPMAWDLRGASRSGSLVVNFAPGIARELLARASSLEQTTNLPEAAKCFQRAASLSHSEHSRVSYLQMAKECTSG
jgi:tetratricopeptide (TPR) repeat protein